MSVCIAAKANKQEIVMVSDHMVSIHSGAFSGDSAMLKVRYLGGGWSVLFAGDDVTPAAPIVRHADKLINPDLTRTDIYTLEEVVARVREAYQAERVQRATDAHLSVYGIDMATFVSEGVARFGETGATILRERIENETLSCELLVCGRGPRGQAHIFTVDHPGTVKNYDHPGYWAIGTGSYLALATLVSRQQSVRRNLAATVYHCCEAKFVAEDALGVGRQSTFVIIDHSDGTTQSLEEPAVSRIKELWEKEARPKYPPTSASEIDAFIKTATRHRLGKAEATDESTK